MADTPSYQPTTPQANRSAEQGLGVGQRDMDAQRDPQRDLHATDPARTTPFGADDGDAKGDGDQAPGSGSAPAALGENTPANVDIHRLGQPDNPEQDWGAPAGEGAAYSANHTRRPEKTESERAQGAKTRTAQKDQISRRG